MESLLSRTTLFKCSGYTLFSPVSPYRLVGGGPTSGWTAAMLRPFRNQPSSFLLCARPRCSGISASPKKNALVPGTRSVRAVAKAEQGEQHEVTNKIFFPKFLGANISKQLPYLAPLFHNPPSSPPLLEGRRARDPQLPCKGEFLHAPSCRSMRTPAQMLREPPPLEHTKPSKNTVHSLYTAFL